VIVSTSATDRVERLVSRMMCYVSSETLNSTHCNSVVKVQMLRWGTLHSGLDLWQWSCAFP